MSGPPRPRWSGRATRRPSCRCRSTAAGCRVTSCDARSMPGSPPGWWSRRWPTPSVPSCDHPEWLRLEGRTVAVLGAGAEMGPLVPLLRWGARVAAVDLPRPAIWTRLLGEAHRRAGRLLLPTTGGGSRRTRPRPGSTCWPTLRPSPTGSPRSPTGNQLVVGNYVYADGATNVRVATAVDVLSTRLLGERPDTALAFLATPDGRVRGAGRGGPRVDRRVRRPLPDGQDRGPTAAYPQRRPACCAARTWPGPTRESTTA